MALIEIRAKGPDAASVADRFFKEAEAAGYTIRVGPGIENLSQGEATFAVDVGDKDRAGAEAEIGVLIAGTEGGVETLSIEPLLPK